MAMNRKRILLCQHQAEGFEPLLGLVSRYFNSAESIFVNLQLKQDRLAAEVVSSPAVINAPKKPVRSTKSHLPRAKKPFRSHEATFREVLRETRFSDVLVIEDAAYQLFCDEYRTRRSGHPSLLSCPILVAPAGEECVEQIILVDDGKPATYRQIKYMACLLPTLCLATPTTLFIARHQDEHVAAQEEKLWIEYLKLHFAHLAVHRIDHRSAHILPIMVDYTKNALLISSARSSSTPLGRALAPLKQFNLILQEV